MDDAILSQLPQSWHPYWHGLCAFVAVCSVLGAGVKLVVGEPKESDGPWRSAMFRVLHLLDLLAANSQLVRDKVAALKRARGQAT